MQDKNGQLMELTDGELDAVAGGQGDSFGFFFDTGAQTGIVIGQNNGEVAENATFNFDGNG